MTGVYKIRSEIKPERCYIGGSINIRKRQYEHFHMLKLNKHHSQILQNHTNKYGINDLVFIIIEAFEFISKKHLLSKEQHYIDILLPAFNIAKTAGNANLGIKFTEKHKENISKALKGRDAYWMKGRKLSNEAKQNLSRLKKGKLFSSEHKEKLRIAKIGRKLSKNHKEKISKSLIGNKRTLGYKQTEETKLKRKLNTPSKEGLNNPNFGKSFSSETKLKMSLSQKKRWREVRKFEQILSTKNY